MVVLEVHGERGLLVWAAVCGLGADAQSMHNGENSGFLRTCGSAVGEHSCCDAAVAVCAGERRWIVTDIIGAEDGLGVENLSGSAAIGTLFCK